jgi:hypothetical protein
MDNKNFKKIFGEIAKQHSFEPAFGGWFRESGECIVILYLQKSNFGNRYYFYIKTYVHGLFNDHYEKSKSLVINNLYAILWGVPNQYHYLFHLNDPIDDNERTEKIKKVFDEEVVPYINKALTLEGIRQLSQEYPHLLSSAYRKQLNEKFQLGV